MIEIKLVNNEVYTVNEDIDFSYGGNGVNFKIDDRTTFVPYNNVLSITRYEDEN